MSTSASIPRFYLYGEPHRAAETRLLHVESLADRSRPSGWTIRPHAHADLNHIFHIAEGGGSIHIEGTMLSFTAPSLIIVPAGAVHGFGWTSESSGFVITISSDYLDRLSQSDLAIADVFKSPFVAKLETGESGRFAQRTADLMAELAWAAPGYRAAAEGGLLDLLVRALRSAGSQEDIRRTAPGMQAALVARFRERIEARFRLREPITSYTDALGASVSRLRSACSAIAGRSPMQILDQRAIVEAQRALLYTNLSIAEIAESIGLPDPAYFSRFFARHTGFPPKTYRSRKLLPRDSLPET